MFNDKNNKQKSRVSRMVVHIIHTVLKVALLGMTSKVALASIYVGFTLGMLISFC